MTLPRKSKSVAERKAELIAQRNALIAAQRKKQKQLAAKLAQLDVREKRKVRKEDAHLKIVFGAGAMAHARINGTWAKQLFDVLRKAETKERDGKLIEAWFQRLAEEQKESRPQIVSPPQQRQA